ncbi:hypothetical protein GF343_03005 [Candidatus Woesearchaeota archaeon]|nr:hypothetical protein [Candidatus Woesearchaeota archaeon]
MEAVPGTGYEGYIRLKDITEKGRVASKKIRFEHKNAHISANGKLLQGLIIAGEYAQIRGTHYTSWENATQIRSMLRIEPSLDDLLCI